jgi:hypothetical protein
MNYFKLFFLILVVSSCNTNPSLIPIQANAETTEESTLSISSEVLSRSKYQFFREHAKEITNSVQHTGDTLYFWDYVGDDDAPEGDWRWMLVFQTPTKFTFEGSNSLVGGRLQVNGTGSLLGESNCAEVLGEITGYDDFGDLMSCSEKDSIGLIITNKRILVEFFYCDGEMDKNEVHCDVSPGHGLDGNFTRRLHDMEE